MKTDMELYKELADKFEKALEDRDAWEREARAGRKLIDLMEPSCAAHARDGCRRFSEVSFHSQTCSYTKAKDAYLAARVPDGETA